ncbi:hypothetical protein D3C71_1534380 [compost metagenome]
MKAVFTVARGLEQVVEHIDHIIVIDHIHRALLVIDAAHTGGALPGGTCGRADIGPGQALCRVACTPVVGEAWLDGVEAAFVAAHGTPAQLIGRAVLIVSAAAHEVGLTLIGVAPIRIFCSRVDRFGSRLTGQASDHSASHTTHGRTDRAPEGACGRTCSSAAHGSAYASADGVSPWFVGQRVTVGIVEIRHRNSPVG